MQFFNQQKMKKMGCKIFNNLMIEFSFYINLSILYVKIVIPTYSKNSFCLLTLKILARTNSFKHCVEATAKRFICPSNFSWIKCIEESVKIIQKCVTWHFKNYVQFPPCKICWPCPCLPLKVSRVIWVAIY